MFTQAGSATHGAALLALTVLLCSLKAIQSVSTGQFFKLSFSITEFQSCFHTLTLLTTAGVVVLAYNPYVGEVEARRAGVQGQPELPSEFKAGVGHLRSILKDTKQSTDSTRLTELSA